MRVMKIMASSNRWTCTLLPYPNFTSKRIRAVGMYRMNMQLLNAKTANLSAAKKERIRLPNYECDLGAKYHISEFLNDPSGIQAMLNTSALRSFELLDINTYRCTLPKVRLLNFEAAPVMDLEVIPTNKDCTVQLLSCKIQTQELCEVGPDIMCNDIRILKFEGSNIVERQNDHFSAFMKNQITWYTNDSESFLEADVKLNLSLEIYTRPFTLLPVSAVESPGNLMMQALVDRLVPVLLQQLLQDYVRWVEQKSKDFS